MRKIIVLITLLWCFTNTSKVIAQDEVETTQVQEEGFEQFYHSEKFEAKLNFNDDYTALLKVFFSTGEKWLEYEIIETIHKDSDARWIIKVKDGMGNIYTINKASEAFSDISVSSKKGESISLFMLETGGD